MSAPDIVGIVLAGGASARFGADKLATDLDGRPLMHHALEAVAGVAGRVVVVVAPDAAAPAIPAALAGRVLVARDAVPGGGPLAGLAAGLAAAGPAEPGAAGAGLAAAEGTPVRDAHRRIAGVEAELAAAEGTPARDAHRRIAGPEAADLARAEADGLAGPAGIAGGDDNPRIAIVVGGDMPALVPAVLRLLAEFLAAEPGLVAMTLRASPPSPLPMALRPALAASAADAILAGNGRRSLRSLLERVPSAAVPETAWRALDPSGATLRDVDTPADLRDVDTPADLRDVDTPADLRDSGRPGDRRKRE